MKNKVTNLMIIVLIMVIASCAPKRTVQRIDPDEEIDLSGRWNDTDSKLAAEELTEQVLNEKWLPRFETSHNNERPVMIVGLIKNKSHEHIDAETFIKDIERSIIKNGSVRLVQAGDKREELRTERADQQEFSSKKTAKQWGQELGADFILQGTINSIVDEYQTQKVVSYQINLELTDLETNEMVWVGDKKIKKYIK